MGGKDMKRLSAWSRGVAVAAAFWALTAIGPRSAWGGQIHEAIRLAFSGPFDLYSTPFPARDGLVATTIRIKARSDQHSIDTIRLLSITGAVHQMWAREDEFDGESFETPLASQYVTVALDNFPDNGINPLPDTAPADRVVDTYLLPPCDTQLECAFVGSIAEDNDESNPLGIEAEPFGTLDGRVDNYKLVLGTGNLYMPTPDDAIVYAPGDRPNWTNLAVIVSVADESGMRPASPVYVAFEVLGRDVSGQPLSNTGRFGLNGEGPLPIAFVPEPSSVIFALSAVALLPGRTLHFALFRRRFVGGCRFVGGGGWSRIC
jgi:hypothetical protein